MTTNKLAFTDFNSGKLSFNYYLDSNWQEVKPRTKKQIKARKKAKLVKKLKRFQNSHK